MNTPTDQRLNERAARAALATHTTPAEVGAHLPGFDAAAAWSQLTGNGRLRHFHPIPALKAAQESARFVIPGDEDWPEGLHDLGPACPFGVWVRGTAPLRPLLKRTVALVGSRAATPAAVREAQACGYDVSAGGGTVLASLAFGVESAAHRGAGIDSGRLAVIPRGLDRCFPRAQEALMRNILTGPGRGAVISLYAPGTEPTALTLAASADVTAALARAVVLVEGIHRSASMQAAEAAQRMQRPLFALLPRDDDGYSSGNTRLIVTGRAKPCQDARAAIAALEEVPHAAAELVTALRAQQVTAWPDASPLAQWITVQADCHRRLRITAGHPNTQRTNYPPAEHSGWHAAELASGGISRTVYRSASTDLTADTAALVSVVRQWAAQT
ncbi:DNA-processing protein DprA [Streptomyces sp. NPDC006476]|uniref:DNA-processing protein DprA n=1 Tax=Streptomyces sp. NPDC006476 TaxID=3157175 RepID=UPI0033BA1543